MAQKRPRGGVATVSLVKKPHTTFRVGPDNLPDGTWRWKAIKIKKSLIHKAKTKKAYAKLKAREPLFQSPRPEPLNPAASPLEESSQALHPERQAMLDTPLEPTASPRTDGRRPRKPDYFKEIAHTEKQKAAVEARSTELDKRDGELKQRIAEGREV